MRGERLAGRRLDPLASDQHAGAGPARSRRRGRRVRCRSPSATVTIVAARRHPIRLRACRSCANGSRRRWTGRLPGTFGIELLKIGHGQVDARMELEPWHLAPNEFLHAATVIAIADSCAGMGCLASLPEEAGGFTTIELKTNFLGTAREGALRCEARMVHGGSRTQVWDSTVHARARRARDRALPLHAVPAARGGPPHRAPAAAAGGNATGGEVMSGDAAHAQEARAARARAHGVGERATTSTRR